MGVHVDVSSVHARLRQRETARDKKRSYSRAKTAQKKAFVFVSVSHHGKGGPDHAGKDTLLAVHAFDPSRCLYDYLRYVKIEGVCM